MFCLFETVRAAWAEYSCEFVYLCPSMAKQRLMDLGGFREAFDDLEITPTVVSSAGLLLHREREREIKKNEPKTSSVKII